MGTIGFVVTVVGGLAICLAEAVAALPGFIFRFLPDMLHHLDVRAQGERGLWLLAASGTGVLVASTGLTSDVGILGEGGQRLRQRLWERKAALVMGCACLGILWSRYEPWVGGRSESHASDFTIDGFALPWMGTLVFAGGAALGIAALIGLLRPGLVSSLLGIFSAWLISLAASLIVIVSGWADELTLSQFIAERHLPHQLATADPKVLAMSAPKIAAAAAFVGLFGGIAALRSAPRHHTERVTARSRLVLEPTADIPGEI